jgi:hypothetical protein
MSMAMSMETSETSGATPIHKLPNTFSAPGNTKNPVQTQFQQGKMPQYSPQISQGPGPGPGQTQSFGPQDQNIQINIHEPSIQPRQYQPQPQQQNTNFNQTHNPNNQPNQIPDHQMKGIMTAIHGGNDYDMQGQGPAQSQVYYTHIQQQGNLQSRDIPMSQQMLIQDEQTQPNYVPEQEPNKKTKTVRFVEEANEKMKVQEENNKTTRRQVIVFDEILDAIHIPIILALLFVVFQMPSINTKLYAFMPSLFLKEGKVGVSGMAVKGVLFAGLYVVLNQLVLFLTSL